jgi:uncharacterized alpha/beta hydrolase family protein
MLSTIEIMKETERLKSLDGQICDELGINGSYENPKDFEKKLKNKVRPKSIPSIYIHTLSGENYHSFVTSLENINAFSDSEESAKKEYKVYLRDTQRIEEKGKTKKENTKLHKQRLNKLFSKNK